MRPWRWLPHSRVQSGPRDEGEPLRRPLSAPPAGGEQAGEASLLLEFLPLARRYAFPHPHWGEGGVTPYAARRHRTLVDIPEATAEEGPSG